MSHKVPKIHNINKVIEIGLLGNNGGTPWPNSGTATADIIVKNRYDTTNSVLVGVTLLLD